VHHTSYSEFFMIKKLVTVMIQNLFIVFLHLVLDVFFCFVLSLQTMSLYSLMLLNAEHSTFVSTIEENLAILTHCARV